MAEAIVALLGILGVLVPFLIGRSSGKKSEQNKRLKAGSEQDRKVLDATTEARKNRPKSLTDVIRERMHKRD